MKSIFLAGLVALSASPAFAFTKMSSVDWLRNIRHGVTQELCGPRSYIRKCTTIGPSKCTPEVVSALDRCVAKMKLPEKIDPLNEGVEMGSQLGQCVGRRVEKTSKRKLNFNESMCRSVE